MKKIFRRFGVKMPKMRKMPYKQGLTYKMKISHSIEKHETSCEGSKKKFQIKKIQ